MQKYYFRKSCDSEYLGYRTKILHFSYFICKYIFFKDTLYSYMCLELMKLNGIFDNQFVSHSKGELGTLDVFN